MLLAPITPPFRPPFPFLCSPRVRLFESNQTRRGSDLEDTVVWRRSWGIAEAETFNLYYYSCLASKVDSPIRVGLPPTLLV
jgi:hypothetical protein